MKSLFRTLFNRGREAADKLNDSIRDEAVDGKWDIKDAEKEALEFRQAIKNAMVANKGLERQVKAAKDEAKKFDNIASQALDAGSESDAESAANEAQGHEDQAKLLEKNLKTGVNQVNKLRQRLKQVEAQIAEAKRTHAVLAAKKEGNQVSKALSDAEGKFGGNSALSRLQNLKKAVESEEDEIEAMNELSTTEAESLEAKYANTGSSGSDRLAKLKAKRAKA